MLAIALSFAVGTWFGVFLMSLAAASADPVCSRCGEREGGP